MASQKLSYEKLHNIRDLGGMSGAEHLCVKEGCLIRCGHLSGIGENDIQRLSELTDIIVDFRTDQECSEQPDAVIPGTTYFHIPIVDKLTEGISREEETNRKAIFRLSADPASAKVYMCKMYRAFIENDFCVSQYRRFVRLLLDEHEKALLWHCTAGKDRAGIASVIIEKILGVPDADIYDDYMMTNECLAEDITYLIEFIKEQVIRNGADFEADDQALKYLFGAEKEYLDSFFDAVRLKFGSFERFLNSGLQLSENDIETIRGRYLV